MEPDKMINSSWEKFDVVVVGGGPAGATAAEELGRMGHSVLLLDNGSRVKPCGGAIPPRLTEDFDIPDEQLSEKFDQVRIFSPSQRTVSMPIEGGYVGMVDRETFDPWLRQRAESHPGVELRKGTFIRLRELGECVELIYQAKSGSETETIHVNARIIIGADGCNSQVRGQGLYRNAAQTALFDLAELKRFLPGESPEHYLSTYQEVVKAPADFKKSDFCEIHYDSAISPDFYGWVFPHGDNIHIGASTRQRSFFLRTAVSELRKRSGLEDAQTIRQGCAPIPLRPLKRWDNGRNVIVIGDAAGLVSPTSGEGIYYAMVSARAAASAVHEALVQNNPGALAVAREQFMHDNAMTFRVLGVMQKFWYSSDQRRERFVTICEDRDVQQLGGNAYTRKKLINAKPLQHAKLFLRHIGHLTGLSAA